MISIIIPTLNEARGLPQLLKAFPPYLRERFDLEIIISDGGSTDDTLGVARTTGARIVQHTAGTPQTIAEARNVGAAQARGEILLFLDADSTLSEPERFLQRITDTMRNPNTLAATTKLQIAPEQRTLADSFWQGLFNITFCWSNRLGFGTARGNCQIIRADAFVKAKGYNEQLVAGEDFDLFHRLGKRGHIAFLTDLVVYESPRRFRRLGYLRTVLLWNLNFFSILLTKRSISKNWQRVD